MFGRHRTRGYTVFIAILRTLTTYNNNVDALLYFI